MPRSRNIKPGFFQNEDLAELGPEAQLLFAGLWTLADKEGRMEDRPKRIKAQIFPYYECDVDTLLTLLHDSRFIQRYLVDDLKLIQVNNWKKHQSPHHKEVRSELPGIDKIKTPEITTINPCLSQAQAKHKPSTTQEQPKKSASTPLIPDSLNLIPDSYPKDESLDEGLAENIFQLILSINPKNKKPNIKNWAEQIRLMRERDNRTREEIYDLFKWANADPFWQGNILSTKKLREQWDQLTIKRATQNANRTQSGNSSANVFEKGTASAWDD